MQFVNNFRAIAILAIVLIHAISAVNTDNSVISNSINVFLNNCSIYFVFIAGYLFAMQANDIEYVSFIKSKFKTIVVPYLFFSIPAVLLYTLDFGLLGRPNFTMDHYWIDMAWFNTLSAIEQCLYLLITGAHLGPYWFIPMIVILYIFSPLFIALEKWKVGLIALVVLYALGTWIGRPQFNENILQAALFFSAPFLAGFICCKSYKHVNISKLIEWVIWIAIALYIFLTLNYTPESHIDLLFKMVMGIGLFFIFKKRVNIRNVWLSMFARLSFFIYFVHGYFIAVIRQLSNANLFPFDGFFGVIVVFSFVIFLCLASFVSLKFILRQKSKYIIGL